MQSIFVEPLVPTSISVTGALAEFPAEELLGRQPSELCMTASSSSAVDMDMVFDTAVAVDTAALLFHSQSQGTLTLYGANSSGALDTAPALGSAAVHAGTIAPGFPYRHGLVFAPPGGTFTHWRLRLDGRAAEVFSAGRLVLGKAFQVDKSLGHGWQPEIADAGDRVAGAHGAVHAGQMLARPAFNLTFDAMSHSDVTEKLLPFVTRNGWTREVLFCADPSNMAAREQMMIYGEMGRLRPARRTSNRWRQKIKITGL